MNIDQIRAFHKVATTGSFTKAARELFLTQSAVSQQIRSLEERIGGTLFDRSGKKIRLPYEERGADTLADQPSRYHAGRSPQAWPCSDV